MPSRFYPGTSAVTTGEPNTTPIAVAESLQETSHDTEYVASDLSPQATEELLAIFRELASSSHRMAATLDQLNALAMEIHSDLSATRQELQRGGNV